MVPLHYYLVLSAILFACGVTGFLIKRNIIAPDAHGRQSRTGQATSGGNTPPG